MMNVAELVGLIVPGDDCGEDNIVPGCLPGEIVFACERARLPFLSPMTCHYGKLAPSPIGARPAGCGIRRGHH
jgi:hypothetical protein